MATLRTAQHFTLDLDTGLFSWGLAEPPVLILPSGQMKAEIGITLVRGGQPVDLADMDNVEFSLYGAGDAQTWGILEENGEPDNPNDLQSITFRPVQSLPLFEKDGVWRGKIHGPDVASFQGWPVYLKAKWFGRFANGTSKPLLAYIHTQPIFSGLTLANKAGEMISLGVLKDGLLIQSRAGMVVLPVRDEPEN